MEISKKELVIISSISFIGGVIILLTNYFSNKYGNLAGLIVTIPSNTVVSLIGLTLITNDIEELQKNIYLSLILSPTTIFYLYFFWIYTPNNINRFSKLIIKNKIKIVSIFSFLIWFIITYFANKYILKIFKNKEVNEILIISLIILILNFYVTVLIKLNYKVNNTKNKNKNFSYIEYVNNFLFSFVIIFTILLIGNINESLGAILSVFPSITFLNSIIIWNKTNNSTLIRDLNINTIFGGISIYMYVLIYSILINKVKVWINVIITLIIILIFFNIPIYLTLKDKKDKKDKENIIYRNEVIII